MDSQMKVGIILMAVLLVATVVCFVLSITVAGLHPMVGHIANG